MTFIDSAEKGYAPRILTAWQAAQKLLEDGQWHTRQEMVETITETGVAPKTAQNIIYAATKKYVQRINYRNGRYTPQSEYRKLTS